VIDNASSDGSTEMIKNGFPGVRFIQNTENIGFAAANNQGMAIAKGRYVLLLNSDTVVLDNAVDKAVAFADSHQQAAVVGCRVLNPNSSLQPTCFMFPSILNMLLSTTYLYKVFPTSRFFGREQMTWWDRNSTRQVDVVTGCFMLVQRKAIEQVGLLDERYFVYGEETDWCCRFKKAGWQILFTPAAEIIHLHSSSSKQDRPAMTLQLRGSILLFLKKHRGHVIHALACLLVALFFVFRVPYWLGLAILQKQGRKVYIQTARTYAIGALQALVGGSGLCIRR